MIPKIEIIDRQHGKNDPTPFQADIWFQDGRNYHGIGSTPSKALVNAALFWASREKRAAVREALDERTEHP